jgi:hypothetical protein
MENEVKELKALATPPADVAPCLSAVMMAKDIATIRAKAEDYMQRYNDEHKVGKLELFSIDYALEHMCRISRIITQDRGSALLVGVGGSGKKSLTRLASCIAGSFTFQLSGVKLLSDKVNNGLLKLGQAEKDVARMKIELAEKEIVLAVAQKNSQALLQEIAISTARAEKTKKEAQVVKDSAHATASKIGKERADVEEDLKLAKPALLEAEDALKAITAKDIQGLKALKTPPDVIKVVFDGVLILKRRPNLGKWQETEIKGFKICLRTYTESKKMSWLTNVRNCKVETTFTSKGGPKGRMNVVAPTGTAMLMGAPLGGQANSNTTRGNNRLVQHKQRANKMNSLPLSEDVRY